MPSPNRAPSRRPLPEDRPEPPAPRDEREERRRRARDEALEVRPRSDRPYPSYEVRNPIHGTRHQVLAPRDREGPVLLCLCPDFGRRDVGTCKHVEAVRLYRNQSHELDPAPRRRGGSGPELWTRIDAALGEEPARPWTDLRPRERTARLLIDRPDG